MVNFFATGRPQIFSNDEIKLFIYVYERFRKRYKNSNQYEVALEIKKAFKETYDSEFYATNLAAERELKIFALTGITRKKYHRTYRDLHYANTFESAFMSLNLYFSYASPAAIVQMKKRYVKK